MTHDFGDQTLVTSDAIVFHHAFAGSLGKNRLVKILEGESLGMAVPMLDFHEVLWQEGLGNMAIIAGGVRVVAGFLPAIKLFPHDMAVHASAGVI